MEAKQGGWVPCDPLAFAAALDSSVIVEAADVACKVETKNPDKRGQTSFEKVMAGEERSAAHSGHVLSKVSQINVEMFAAMIKAGTDD